MRTVTLYRTYANMEDLVIDYESGNIDSAEVKRAFEKEMNRILQVTLLLQKIVPKSYPIICR